MERNILGKIFFFVCAVVLLMLFMGTAVQAGETPRKEPAKVTVGIYLTDIYDVDLKKSTYNADFYIWFIWKGPVDPKRFEIVNGHLTFKHEESNASNGDLNHVSYRCRAMLHGNFDLSDYPWDRQGLKIQIEDEDLDADNLIYVADRENSKIDSSLKVGMRTLGDLSITEFRHVYGTNFGNPTKPTERNVYSRISLELPAAHGGVRIFLKTFLSLFISVAVAFLTFTIRPCDLPPRFSTGISGMFGAVASLVVISNSLEECPFLTFAEKVHYAGMIFIFLSVLESSISLKLYHAGKEKAWRILDNLSLGLLTSFFIFFVLLLTP